MWVSVDANKGNYHIPYKTVMYPVHSRQPYLFNMSSCFLLIPNSMFRNMIAEVEIAAKEELFCLIYIYFSMHYVDDFIETGWRISK